MIFFILFIIALAVGGFFVTKLYLAQKKLILNDDVMEQWGVIVEFKKGLITVKKQTYTVSQITRVSLAKNSAGSLSIIRLEFDDINRPIQEVAIGGAASNPQDFFQRLSVAIRKAGGKSFN